MDRTKYSSASRSQFLGGNPVKKNERSDTNARLNAVHRRMNMKPGEPRQPSLGDKAVKRERMALPASRFNIGTPVKKTVSVVQEEDENAEAKKRALKKRSVLKPAKESPEEDVINKRKMVNY